MEKKNKKSPSAKTNDKSKIEVIIKSGTSKLCNRKEEDRKQFIKIDQYGELIDILTDFPDGEDYFVKPILLYLDEEEIEDSYYVDAIEKYGLTERQCFIQGLDIIASKFSAGYIGLLQRFGFLLDEAESNTFGIRLVFDHIAFNRL